MPRDYLRNPKLIRQDHPIDLDAKWGAGEFADHYPPAYEGEPVVEHYELGHTQYWVEIERKGGRMYWMVVRKDAYQWLQQVYMQTRFNYWRQDSKGRVEEYQMCPRRWCREDDVHKFLRDTFAVKRQIRDLVFPVAEHPDPEKRPDIDFIVPIKNEIFPEGIVMPDCICLPEEVQYHRV